MIYTDIQEQFNKVIAYSQGIPDPKTDELFENWLEAKRSFIEAFGGKLIYEVPVKVSFTLDMEEKKVRLNDFIDTVYNIYSNEALGSFLEQESEGFFSNVVVHDYESEKGKIPRGMKLVKAFKFFEGDKKTLETIQDDASRVIQENKIEGTLCFSVHPLDYLSSSENTYNWRSCHALDGEYRSGNLSYMTDSSTVVCYLRGSDNVNIPLFPSDVPWNSKKWRMLLYFSENWDIIFAGRQYPFTSTPGLEVVRNELMLMFHETTRCVYTLWCNNYISAENTNLPIDFKYIPVRGELLSLTDIVPDDSRDALHFNDLLRSSCYTNPYYMIKNNYAWARHETSHPRVMIGRKVKCLYCGKENITNPETMMCDDCELEYGHEENEIYGTCDCCGARVIRDDAISVGEEIVCDACFATECFICDYCDEVHFKSEEVYNKDHCSYMCKYCYDSRGEE